MRRKKILTYKGCSISKINIKVVPELTMKKICCIFIKDHCKGEWNRHFIRGKGPKMDIQWSRTQTWDPLP